MRKLLLKICYDGTHYCGWQVQPNGVTVQQKICEALFDLLKVKTDVTGCSRTDSGVHANEFYCHFVQSQPTMGWGCQVKNSFLSNTIALSLVIKS